MEADSRKSDRSHTLKRDSRHLEHDEDSSPDAEASNTLIPNTPPHDNPYPAASPEQQSFTEVAQLSHLEMKQVFREGFSALLQKDAVLADLHPDVTWQEVSDMIEVEAGRSMLVSVIKADGGVWQLRLPRAARYHHLKRALRTQVNLSIHREGGPRNFSWRSFWRSYWLALEGGQPITDEHAALSSLGIGHKARLVFVKRRREKRGQRGSRA